MKPEWCDNVPFKYRKLRFFLKIAPIAQWEHDLMISVMSLMQSNPLFYLSGNIYKNMSNHLRDALRDPFKLDQNPQALKAEVFANDN